MDYDDDDQLFKKDSNPSAAAFGSVIFVPLNIINLLPGVFAKKAADPNASTFVRTLATVCLALSPLIQFPSRIITQVLGIVTGSNAKEHADKAANILGLETWGKKMYMAACTSPDKGSISILLSYVTGMDFRFHVGRMITTIPGMLALGAGIIITTAAKAIVNGLSSLMSNLKSNAADQTIKNTGPTLTTKNLGKLKNGGETPTASMTSGSNSPRSSMSSDKSNEGTPGPKR